jgi:hypothetical protein
MDEAELNATTVLHMDIEEATVKCRTGPPDDADEADFPVWSGVIPVVTQLGTPQPAPEQSAAVPLPHALTALVRSGGLRKT